MTPYEPTPRGLERDIRSLLLVLDHAHAYLDWRDGPYVTATDRVELVDIFPGSGAVSRYADIEQLDMFPAR